MNQPWKMPEDEAVQMPLGVGQEADASSFDPDESVAVERPPRRVDTATAVLFGLFSAGVGMIYLLGVHARPPKANAAAVASDARLNQEIAQLLGKSGNAAKDISLSKKTDRLIKMFYAYPGKASPPASVLRGNPFALHVTPAAIRPIAVDDPGASRLRRLAALARSFAGLRLQSILYGDNSATAMINDRLVRVGSKIGKFSVLEIKRNKVVLARGKRKFALRLSGY